jgi:GNAT superfamily N-acetyltransferase
MNDLQIQQATTTDAEKLAQIYQNAYQENRELGFPAKAESVTEREVSAWIQSNRVYVATVDDEIIGGVRLETTDSERVKLSRLGVHERWKGEGIRSTLVEYAEKTVRDWGYATIWLTSPENHPYLPGFYRRRGYEKAEIYPLEYRSYDEIIMEKQIR